MPCYEPLCCNANRKPIPLFSLYNSLNFPDSIAINYCAPSHFRAACLSGLATFQLCSSSWRI
jgi:hypothetical protein